MVIHRYMVASLAKTSSMRAYVALVVLYFVWGTTLAAMRIGIESFPPSTLIFVRYLMGGVILLLFCLARGEAFPAWQSMKRDFMVGFLIFFAGNTFIYFALQYIPTGIAGLIMATAPFFLVSLATWIPPREEITGSSWAGLLIGFLGMGVLFVPKLVTPEGISAPFILSVAGLFIMNFFWALGSIVAKRHPNRVSLLMSIGIQNIFAGLMALAAAFFIPGGLAFEPSLPSTLALVYLIMMGTFIGIPCFFTCLKELPIALAGTPTYVAPIITIFVGALLFGEVITAEALIAAALIITGVIVVQLNRQKPHILSRPPIPYAGQRFVNTTPIAFQKHEPPVPSLPTHS